MIGFCGCGSIRGTSAKTMRSGLPQENSFHSGRGFPFRSLPLGSPQRMVIGAICVVDCMASAVDFAAMPKIHCIHNRVNFVICQEKFGFTAVCTGIIIVTSNIGGSIV